MPRNGANGEMGWRWGRQWSLGLGGERSSGADLPFCQLPPRPFLDCEGHKSGSATSRSCDHDRGAGREYSVYGILWVCLGMFEFTDEFRDWWDALSEEQQDDVAHSVRHLIEFGPALSFPHTSKINSSCYPQMRELRTQSGGRPLRTLYAFDPRRSAILLIGGEKTGDDRWYEKFVPVADRIFERHLDQLKKERST